MAKIEDYQVEVAFDVWGKAPSSESIRSILRRGLEAALNAKPPEVEVITEAAKRAGQGEVSKAYWGRTSIDWYEIAAVNAYRAMHSLERIPEVTDEAVRAYWRAAYPNALKLLDGSEGSVKNGLTAALKVILNPKRLKARESSEPKLFRRKAHPFSDYSARDEREEDNSFKWRGSLFYMTNDCVPHSDRRKASP